MKWEILPGLPGYGEILQFAGERQRTFSEGLVVRAEYADGSSWIGNFQPGVRGGTYFSGVFEFPGEDYLWVISGGQAYYVPEKSPDKYSMLNFGPAIDIRVIEESKGLVFLTFTDMYAYQGLEEIWRTDRISTDDLEVVSMNKRFIEVQVWNPGNRPTEYPVLKIDLETGKVIKPWVKWWRRGVNSLL